MQQKFLTSYGETNFRLTLEPDAGGVLKIVEVRALNSILPLIEDTPLLDQLEAQVTKAFSTLRKERRPRRTAAC